MGTTNKKSLISSKSNFQIDKHEIKFQDCLNLKKSNSISKITEISKTLECLEKSLRISRNLEADQLLKYSILKTENALIKYDLDKANKRNKNMINLFRQSVTDIRIGYNNNLPPYLQREVQKIWHQKYDILLLDNKRLKEELKDKEIFIKQKEKEIVELQSRLLNLSEHLIKREKVFKNIHKKYDELQSYKEKQELILKQTIDTLQKAKNESSRFSFTSMRDATLQREIQKNRRLIYENGVMKRLLQESKRKLNISSN